MLRQTVLSSAITALTMSPLGLTPGLTALPAATVVTAVSGTNFEKPKPAQPQLTAAELQQAAAQKAAADAAAKKAAQVQAVAATLAAHGLKPDYAQDYVNAQDATGTPWQLIAAVHKVETNQSGDTAIRSYAGAEGPMQFMPGTFAHYALPANGHSTADITNVDDAIYTGANYLRAGGAANGNYIGALLTYNHSLVYANHVYGIAHQLGL